MGDGASRRRGDQGSAARAQLAALFGDAAPKQEDPRDALESLFGGKKTK
jgi:hypothetical protein